MRRALQSALIGLVSMGAVACELPAPIPSSASPAGQLAPPKRIVLGVWQEQNLSPGISPMPGGVVRPLVNPGLALFDDRGSLQPILAESVPTLENGLWTLLPDGRMETTWRLRANAGWQDGVPLTASDLAFTIEVGRAGNLLGLAFSSSVENVRAVEPRTAIVVWKEVSITADRAFGPGMPLPRHVLEAAYHENPSALESLPYWREGYVGAGPYRVREWTPLSRVILDANPNYALGPPRIGEIEIRLIPDPNTLAANVLSDTIDLVPFDVGGDLGPRLRDQWRGGVVVFNSSDRWMAVSPQFIGPHPAVILEVRFRRALLRAIDRQALMDVMTGGTSEVAHSFLSPNQGQYLDIESELPRYPYDPRTARQEIEVLGYQPGPDGSLQDASHQTLEIEVRRGFGQSASQIVADHWRRLGMSVTEVAASPAQVSDLEWLATFPAFYVRPRPNDQEGLRPLQRARTPLPENRFRVQGIGNLSRYMDPNFDDLIDRYFRTISSPDRTRVLGQIIYRLADELTVMGLYYINSAEPVSYRLSNVPLVHAAGSWITWNIQEWDLRG